MQRSSQASPYEAASPTSTMRSSGEEPAQRPENLAFSIHRISEINAADGKRKNMIPMITNRHSEDDLLAHEIELAKEILREGTSGRRMRLTVPGADVGTRMRGYER